jgi:DNA repair exonuclease SbcCD ATPase subunit
MENKAKSSVILLIALMLIFLSAAGTGFYLYQKEHAKNIELEEKIEELNIKQKITEAKFFEAQKIISSLEVKIKESVVQINELSDEISKEQAAKEEVLSNLEKIKQEIEQQKALKLDLENKLSQAQNEVRSMQGKLVTLDSDKKDLELKIKDLEEKSQGVELGKIVVSPEPVKTDNVKGKNKAKVVKENKEVEPAEKGVEGKVLVVNKEYNFVVINLGSKDGVGLGQVFSIYRGNSYLGDVKVEKLHDSMAAAGFISEDTKAKVKEGDKVIKKS